MIPVKSFLLSAFVAFMAVLSPAMASDTPSPEAQAPQLITEPDGVPQAVTSPLTAKPLDFVGIPHTWQLGFQTSASPVKEFIDRFHNEMLVVITAITLLVLALLIWVCIRYSAKRNPVPSTTSHNTLVEVVWTVIPVLILVYISIDSFKLLYYGGRIPEAEMTIKTTGYQWYWGYEYPDHGGITFNAYMIPEKDIDPSKGQKRLLDTDNVVVLPVDTTIRVQVTAADVLHSWAVPALGVKKDAVPGRLNETWLHIDKPGVYYGQCSEICGTGHAYMPIMIKAVPKADFEKWVEDAKVKFGANETLAPVKVAAGTVQNAQ